MVWCLKHLSRFFVLFQIGGMFALSQEQPLERITHAANLNEHGHFRAAMALVEPLLREPGSASKDPVIGMAWNVRGLALQNLGQSEEARKSYESAIEILRNLPAYSGQYAAALDNLGSVKAEMGEVEESRQLRIHAQSLYQASGDHLGLARVKNSLVLISLGQGKRKDARRYLQEALQEILDVKAPLGDEASSHVTECLVDRSENRFRDALVAINQSIDLWRREGGDTYYLLSTGYSLRGQTYDALGDREKAIDDFHHALDVLKANGKGHQSTIYLLTEISFAKVLRHSGKKQDAAQMESTARSELDELRQQQCATCTLSAQSFR